MNDTTIPAAAVALRTDGMVTSMRAPDAGKSFWRGVVKVQRTINPGGRVMIYNEARSILHQEATPPDVAALFEPDEWKFFAEATFDHGVLRLERRTVEREW